MVDVEAPDFGFTSPPAGAAGLVPSMDHEALRRALEYTGPRFAWACRAPCPCNPNPETLQYDPLCPQCNRHPGHIYFGPPVPPSAPDPSALPLTPLQTTLLGSYGLIRGVTYNIRNQTDLFSTFGRWEGGDAFITTAHYNQLAPYDRLIALDSLKPFAEIVEWSSGLIQTRYPAAEVQFVSSLSTVYVQGVDYALADTGELRWLNPPTGTTILTVRYKHHPVWVVVEEPHFDRVMQTRDKVPTLTTAGTPEHFPVKAHLRYEYLTDKTRVSMVQE